MALSLGGGKGWLMAEGTQEDLGSILHPSKREEGRGRTEVGDGIGITTLPGKQ